MKNRLYIKYFESLIVALIAGNFILNIVLNDYKVPHYDFRNIFFSIFIFFLLYFIGNSINQLLDLESISFSIILYLISFFAFQFLFLFSQNERFDFNLSFLIVNFLWSISIIFSRKRAAIQNYIYAIFVYMAINLIKDFFGDKLFKNILKNGDVEYFWFPMTKMIYENNLNYALINNIEPGYGLLINNTYAVLGKLSLNISNFEFSPSIINVFLFLFILFVIEQEFSNSTKIILLILFFSIVVNSPWLSYLFTNSLMGEAVVNLFFPITLVMMTNNKFKTKKIRYFSFFIIGFLYLSKPFVSILILIFILFISIKNRQPGSLLFGATGLVINFINYNFIINIPTSNNYLSISEFYNLKNLQTIKIENITKILKNLIELDRVMALFVGLLFLFVMFSKYINKKIQNKELLSLLILNLGLVFLLYITIWQDRELESAYRYIFSAFNLYIIYFGIMREKLNS